MTLDLAAAVAALLLLLFVAFGCGHVAGSRAERNRHR